MATIARSIGPAQIDHLDRDKVVTVEANTEGRSLSEVTRDINRRVAEACGCRPAYALRRAARSRARTRSSARSSPRSALAVLLMYLILVVQFGSFLDPLAILLSLPLSLIGVVLALLITGDTLNLMSLIGVILLMGIVAKNAILLIDFAKWADESRACRCARR